jgi:hypothetical protein
MGRTKKDQSETERSDGRSLEPTVKRFRQSVGSYGH